jgi:acyl-CoA thioester hydrolase
MPKNTMDENHVQLRVRYSETDQMGVVYHGRYIPYFEIGRVEWLRNQGVSYKSLEESGIALPIVSMTVNFKKSARYDDWITVKTVMKKYSSVKLEFHCEIWSEQNELLTTAQFILCFVDLKTGRPVAPPEHIKTILSNL